MVRPAPSALTIALTLFLLITAFYIPYYDKSFHIDNRGDVRNATAIHDDLMQYLNQKYFDYDRTHFIDSFSTKEQEHLADVKFLIDVTCILYYLLILVIAALLIYLDSETAFQAVSNAGTATIGTVLIIGLFALLDFTLFWELFHAVVFPQGGWRFPGDALLIQLYPSSYFKAFTQRFGLAAVTLGALTWFLGWGGSYLERREK